MSIGVVAVVLSGCGSTADDRLVLRFLRFDNTNIDQADAVRQTSADVDVIQDLCSDAMGGAPTAEPFTQTTINAVFQNEEGADIFLHAYTMDIGNARLSQANIPGPDASGNLGVTLPGLTETTVSGIVLFDFVGKDIVFTVATQHPEVLGQPIPVHVTFFGRDDADRSFQVTANYLVTFGNFDNCMSSSGGAGSS
jgi:hypothetical protein